MPERTAPVPPRPSPKPKLIGVCLVGMSPAVVTETLYALAILQKPKIIPEKVLLLTTLDAYRNAVASLLGPKGAIAQLRREYRLPPGSLQCSMDDVVLLKSREGNPLGDIRSSTDSRAAGETIVRLLEKLHTEPGVELHCSVAGGRKTMGVLLALALQLTSRPGDRLYHVLVNEPYEKIPDFFYPPRKKRVYILEKRRISSQRARIDLAEVPLVRLGTVAAALGLHSGELARRASAMEAMVNRHFQPPHLSIDAAEGEVGINGHPLRLPPQEFVLYALYAGLRANCMVCSRDGRPGCNTCHPSDRDLFDKYREILLDLYTRLRMGRGDRFEHLLSDHSGSSEVRLSFDEWLRQTRSRLHSRLRTSGFLRQHGPSLLIRRVTSWAGGGEHRHGLSLAPKLIAVSNVGNSILNVRKAKEPGNSV